MGIGKDKYACPGMPNGVACKSVTEMYELTGNGNVPLPLHKTEKTEATADDNLSVDGDVIFESDPETDRQPAARAQSGAGVYEPSRETKQLAREYIAPNLGRYPIPIRTPAKVMRIWIAPFEDGDDLVMAGYVYTEIEPRRWVITEEGVERPSKGKLTYHPLKK